MNGADNDGGLWSEPAAVDRAPEHGPVTAAAGDDVLPGLEADAPADGSIVKAARRTLRALEQSGDLEDRHAVMAAALVVAARSLDRAAAPGGKTKEYAVANLTREIRETWTALQPETTEGAEGDEFDALAADLRDAMADEQRRAAAVRDGA